MTAPSPRGPWTASATRTDNSERTPLVFLLAKERGESIAQLLAGPCRFVLDENELHALRVAVEQADDALHTTRQTETVQRRAEEKHDRLSRSQQQRKGRR